MRVAPISVCSRLSLSLSFSRMFRRSRDTPRCISWHRTSPGFKLRSPLLNYLLVAERRDAARCVFLSSIFHELIIILMRQVNSLPAVASLRSSADFERNTVAFVGSASSSALRLEEIRMLAPACNANFALVPVLSRKVMRFALSARSNREIASSSNTAE